MGEKLKIPRCLVTGKPVGTVVRGLQCKCSSCQEYEKALLVSTLPIHTFPSEVE